MDAMDSSAKKTVLATGGFASFLDTRDGKLDITQDNLIFWSKKTLFRDSTATYIIDVNAIDSFKITGDHNHAISLIMRDRDTKTIYLHDSRQAQGLFEKLKEHLGHLDEISRSESERRKQEKIRREEELKRKQAQQQLYATCLWSHIEGLRVITRAIYQILSGLRLEDWNSITENYRLLWQQAEKLQVVSGFALTARLNDLGKACADSDGVNAAQCCVSFFESVISDYSKNLPGDLKNFGMEIQNTIRPDGTQIPYFLLFYTLHHELVLSSELGDWITLDKALELEEKIVAIVDKVFDIKVQPYITSLIAAAKKRDLASLKRASNELETFLHNAAVSHPFQEVS